MTSHSKLVSDPRHPRQSLPTGLALVWISIGLSLATGCTKATANQPVEPAPSVCAAPTPLAPGGDLMTQLAAEAAARPAKTASVEQVVAALAAQGIELGAFQQSIARTHGASYCGNVRSAGLYVFVCEYTGPEQLAAGKPLTPAGAAQAQQALTVLAGL